MRKRGYTLIEVIVVIAILLVIMPIFINGKSTYKLIDTITSKSLKNDIANIISFAKHYSYNTCLLYTSPSPRDRPTSRMPSSA